MDDDEPKKKNVPPGLYMSFKTSDWGKKIKFNHISIFSNVVVVVVVVANFYDYYDFY